MKNSVFISGSISIGKLPELVKQSIDNIIKRDIGILVGDANGVDTLVQNYCTFRKYFDLTVYSILPIPRYKADGRFKLRYIEVKESIKKKRERQTEKDKSMAIDSEFSFIIWDSKSKGSYANIMRAIDLEKGTKIFLAEKDDFLTQDQITRNNVEFIYRDHNGYSAAEAVELLKESGFSKFKGSRDFYQYLRNQSIIRKINSVYCPLSEYEHLFFIEKYRGKAKGIKFRNEFISWIKNNIQEFQTPTQPNLFT